MEDLDVAHLASRLGPSMRHATLAWALGLISIAFLAFGADSPSIAVAAVTCAILGSISLNILGYAYEIVSFQALETAKSRDPQTPLPPLSKALPQQATGVTFWLLGTGTALTAAFSLTPFPVVIGTLIYLVGAACASAAILALAMAYLRIPRVAHST